MEPDKIIDFTNCTIDKAASYGGSDQKRGIIYDGKHYMLKYANHIEDDKRLDNLNSSYSNSVYSEHICCKILNELGFEAQHTILGTIDLPQANNNIETKPVVACENFVQKGWELVEFKDIERTLLSNKPGKIPKLNDLYDIYYKENAYFDLATGKDAMYHYWKQFVLDAYMGNFDRHAQNWGYLVNKESYELKYAPIYDCGSCLYPQLSDKGIESTLNNEQNIRERIDKFPTAALEIEGRKANYRDFLLNVTNPECLRAIAVVVPLIKEDIAKEVINAAPLNDLRKDFYKTMLHARFERIIVPAYERTVAIMQQQGIDLRIPGEKSDPTISEKMETVWNNYFSLPKDERKGIEWNNKKVSPAEFDDLYLSQCEKENKKPLKEITDHFWKNCVEIQGYTPRFCRSEHEITIK